MTPTDSFHDVSNMAPRDSESGSYGSICNRSMESSYLNNAGLIEFGHWVMFSLVGKFRNEFGCVLCDRIFSRNTTPSNSGRRRSWVDSTYFTPFGKSFLDPVDYNLSVISSVIGLLFSSRPPAISWLVISVIVVPFDLFIRGSFTHV